MRMDVSFWKAGHWPTLLSAFLYFDASFMIWVLLGALGNHVASEFNLSAAQKGLMTALPLLGGSVLRLVFGYLSDRFGGRRAGLIGLTLTFVPLLMGWLWADSVSDLYCVGVLLGVAGASFAVALPMASRWYPARYQGLVMGIAGAGNSGTVLSTFFAPRLAEMYGWPGVFGLAMIPLAAVALVFVLFAKDAPNGGSSSVSGSGMIAVLWERDLYLFSLLYAVTFGGFAGLASFLSVLLCDQYGLLKVQAGDLASLCVLAGSFLRPVGGLLADRMGGIRILSVLYGLIAILFIGLAQMPPLAGVITLFVLAMGCFGIGNGAIFQLVPQRFKGRVGAATGILGAAGGIGGFCLPVMLGWLKGVTGDFSVGLALFSGVSIVALTILAVVQSEWIGVWIGKQGRVQEARGLVTYKEIPAAR